MFPMPEDGFGLCHVRFSPENQQTNVLLPQAPDEKLKRATTDGSIRKSEMQRELDALRRQLHSLLNSDQDQQPLSLPARDLSPRTGFIDCERSRLLPAVDRIDPSYSVFPELDQISMKLPLAPMENPTRSQTLEGQEIDSKRIDDCFNL